MMINSYYGSNARTRKFSDIFGNANVFLQTYKENPLYQSVISDERVIQIYYYLYGAYGNSSIASYDEHQFKYKLWTIISTKGLVWSRRQDITEAMAQLSDEDIKKRSVQWTNFSQDPGRLSDGKISEDIFLDYIQNQNVTQGKKADAEAYADYIQLLGVGIGNTQDFINQFKKLFKVVVDYEAPLYYESEDYNNGE